jgi:arylsulfatase A-like enzyme
MKREDMRLATWLGVGALLASFDAAQVIVRAAPLAALQIAALIAYALLIYGFATTVAGALLGGLGLRIGTRYAPVLYVVGFLVISAACGFSMQSALPDRNSHIVANAADENASPRPNILLITMDTLRRDHLGCYGYAGARTPHIDALAAQSVVFDDAVTPISLTGPSHTTMLTGLYPLDHGVETNGITLAPDKMTITDSLRAVGYRTAAFVSGWTMKDRSVGLGPHFDVYDDRLNCSVMPDIFDDLAVQHFALRGVERLTGYGFLHIERLGELTTERASEWLAHRDERPFFALVHYFDAHGPHVAPALAGVHRVPAPVFDYWAKAAAKRAVIDDPARTSEAVRAYDDEISYVDAQVGALLALLEETGDARDTVVIVTADHGESLVEHGWYFDHGEYLYETCVRVPLMIRFPDGRYAGTRRAEQVRLLDLAPTIAEIAGVPAPNASGGESLLAVADGTEQSARTSFGSIRMGTGEGSRARYYIRTGGYKLIWNFDHREAMWSPPAYEELYDLSSDPNEEHDEISQPPPIAGELRDRLRAYVEEKSPHVRQPRRDVRAWLRALGYQ